MAPLGALKAALEEDVSRPPPSYLTEDERKRMVEALLAGGFTGPTCYYKVQVRGFNREDELCASFHFLLSIGRRADNGCDVFLF